MHDNEMESVKLDFTQFRTINDLVRFAVLSNAHFIYHTTSAGKEIYFIHVFSPVRGAVYFAKHDKTIREKYSRYDPYKDMIDFTSKFEINPNKIILPFLEIDVDTVFSNYPIERKPFIR